MSIYDTLTLDARLRLNRAAPEMYDCLRAMVADHSIRECDVGGPCWPHRILRDLDTALMPPAGDPDHGRRGD